MQPSARDAHYLRMAIQLSERAVKRGNHPFGCVVVARPKEDVIAEAQRSDKDVVLVEAMNSVHTEHDPSGHAETNAIREMGRVLHFWALENDGRRLPDSHTIELFTSTEPCVMCCGAIYWSFAVDRVVYACSESGLAQYAGADFLCPCRDTFRRGARRVQVDGPFLEEEAVVVHSTFWKDFFAKLQHATESPRSE